MLSASGEEQDVLGAIKAGATGYLVKSASREELLEAVRRTAAGDAVFTPGLAGLVLGEFRRMMSDPRADAPTGPRLTERETEILRLVALGHTNAEIAEMLFLSVRTIDSHRANIQRKLECRNRAGLVRAALARGLLEA